MLTGHESAVFELLQSLADRNRTHAETLDKFPFGEMLPGAETPGDDVILNDRDDLGSQRFGLDRFLGRRDLRRSVNGGVRGDDTLDCGQVLYIISYGRRERRA